MTEQERAAALADEIERDDPVILHHETDRHALIVRALRLLDEVGPDAALLRINLAAAHRRIEKLVEERRLLAERSAPHAPDGLREVVARAFAECEFGFRLQLVRLVDGISTYRLTTADGEPDAEFEDQDDAYAELGRRKAKARSNAVVTAIAARGLVILPREPTQEMIRDVACALARDAGIADPLANESHGMGQGAYWMCWESEARVALRAALTAKEP